MCTAQKCPISKKKDLVLCKVKITKNKGRSKMIVKIPCLGMYYCYFFLTRNSFVNYMILYRHVINQGEFGPTS